MNLSILLIFLVNIRYLYAVALFVPQNSQVLDLYEKSIQEQLINVLNSEYHDYSMIQNEKKKVKLLEKINSQKIEDLLTKRIFNNNDGKNSTNSQKGAFFRRPCPSYLLSCYFYG
jgi:hypothetical protein